MMPFYPLHDNIVVLPSEESDHLHGNILVPDLGRERPEIGKVGCVGPGRSTEYGHYITPDICIGDIVLIPKIGFIRVEYDNQEYFVGPYREVLCKINK